ERIANYVSGTPLADYRASLRNVAQQRDFRFGETPIQAVTEESCPQNGLNGFVEKADLVSVTCCGSNVFTDSFKLFQYKVPPSCETKLVTCFFVAQSKRLGFVDTLVFPDTALAKFDIQSLGGSDRCR